MEVGVAGYADGGASMWVDFSDFTTLQPDGDIADLLSHLFLGHDDGKGTGASAEDSALALGRTDVVDLRPQRNHLDGKAVASESSLCSQHTGVHDAAHALQQVGGDA